MAQLFDRDRPYRHDTMIRGVILDNDNTLYREPDDAPQYHQGAAILAVQNQLPEMDEGDIRAAMLESKKKYGSSLDTFEIEHGLDMEQLREDHYRFLIELTQGSDFFTDAETPRASLEDMQLSGLSLYIATHGNDEWTNYTLHQNRIADMFDDAGGIIHKDDVPDHKGKNKGPEMLNALLDQIGEPDQSIGSAHLRGAEYAMVDDQAHNLKFAKELGMMTILVDDHGITPPDKLPAYVDIVVRDRNDIAPAVLRSNYALTLEEYGAENVRQFAAIMSEGREQEQDFDDTDLDPIGGLHNG